MEAKEFDRILEEECQRAEKVIRSCLPEEKGRQRRLTEAMNYSLTAGGKRLRPILMAKTCRMCGGAEPEILGGFMAAMEMIHTYSLVHDDLPAMDNDCYRRGKRTTWYVYGEAMGILAGDGLLNCAFETALKAVGHWMERQDIFGIRKAAADGQSVAGPFCAGREGGSLGDDRRTGCGCHGCVRGRRGGRLGGRTAVYPRTQNCGFDSGIHDGRRHIGRGRQ